MNFLSQDEMAQGERDLDDLLAGRKRVTISYGLFEAMSARGLIVVKMIPDYDDPCALKVTLGPKPLPLAALPPV